jgi:phosphate transport system substrate-binding protein
MTVRIAWLAVASALILGAAAPARAVGITGGGATFPYPLYAKWAAEYRRQTGIAVNYQSIGSGGGIRQMIAGTLDFGASDMPLGAADLDRNGLMQFPAIVGGVVPVYNLKGVPSGRLKLTGELLADIFLGRVRHWNDPAIQALNTGVTLPAQPIVVVYRADGSGTTFLWTNYLSKMSRAWSDTVGSGTSVKYPVGQGGKGNEGVASYVRRFEGAMGYVEYAYARQNDLAVGELKNRAGNFVAPGDEAFAAAASGADWAKAPRMIAILTDQPGARSWPITGASFILMRRAQSKAATAREVLRFFDWAYRNGDTMAAQLGYVPLPDAVVKVVEAAWKQQIRDAAGKAIY